MSCTSYVQIMYIPTVVCEKTVRWVEAASGLGTGDVASHCHCHQSTTRLKCLYSCVSPLCRTNDTAFWVHQCGGYACAPV